MIDWHSINTEFSSKRCLIEFVKNHVRTAYSKDYLCESEIERIEAQQYILPSLWSISATTCSIQLRWHEQWHIRLFSQQRKSTLLNALSTKLTVKSDMKAIKTEK
jgi:hypothetical protein